MPSNQAECQFSSSMQVGGHCTLLGEAKADPHCAVLCSLFILFFSPAPVLQPHILLNVWERECLFEKPVLEIPKCSSTADVASCSVTGMLPPNAVSQAREHCSYSVSFLCSLLPDVWLAYWVNSQCLSFILEMKCSHSQSLVVVKRDVRAGHIINFQYIKTTITVILVTID